MKKAIIDSGALRKLAEDITSESLNELNLDALAEALTAAAAQLEEAASLRQDCRLLKDEYRARILGMLKAIIACKPDDDSAFLASRLTGDIEQFRAEQLIRQYHRVAARFRNSFPASFRYLNFGKGGDSAKRWEEHKI